VTAIEFSLKLTPFLDSLRYIDALDMCCPE